MEQSTVAEPVEQETSPSGGRGADLLVVVGLLVLLGGAVGYIIKTTSPANLSAATAPKRDTQPAKPLTTDAFDAILNTGQKLINEGKLTEAEALYKQVLASHPEAQQVHIEYARLLAGQSRAAEAYKQYQDALALGNVEPQVQLEAGTAANMSGQFQRALEHFSAAQAASPTDYRPPLYLAQVQIKLKQPEEAKKNLLLVTKLKPTAAAPAWGTLAQIYLDEGKPDFAISMIIHARELDPKSTVYRVIGARAYKRNGDPDAALQLLVGLSDAEKREPGVLQVMSECYGMLNRPKDAAEMYVTASDQQPTNGEWAFQAAVWLDKIGDKKRAYDYAKRAATLNVEGAAAMVERLK